MLITIERSTNIYPDNCKIIVHCITLIYNFEDKLSLPGFFFFLTDTYLFGWRRKNRFREVYLWGNKNINELNY